MYGKRLSLAKRYLGSYRHGAQAWGSAAMRSTVFHTSRSKSPPSPGRGWLRRADQRPPVTVTGAARAADGELWITIGERWTAGAVDPLWRKPSEGPWTSVPLPELEGWFSRDKARVFDAWDISNEPWLAMERPPMTTVPWVMSPGLALERW